MSHAALRHSYIHPWNMHVYTYMLLLGVYLGLQLYVFSFRRYCLFSKVVVVV